MTTPHDLPAEVPSVAGNAPGEELLDQQACLALLAQRSVGRVAYTERALPWIRPVRYAVVDGQVLLRLRPDGLAERLDRQVVALAVDDADDDGEERWRVVVTGAARLLRDAPDFQRLGLPPVVSWTGGAPAKTVLIGSGHAVGRRTLP